MLLARAIAAFLPAVALAAPAPAPPDLDALLHHLDDLYRSRSSIGRMELSVTGPRVQRSLRLKAWTIGEDRALVVIEAPPREAGTATLKVGENLWNWLPRIARTIRVPPSMMLGSWMGTDFTNDDLVKESSLRKDFTTRIEARTADPPGWKLVSDVRPGVVGRWQRIETFVSDERLPVREVFYDRKGRRARTLTFDDVRALGGRRLPARLTLLPEDDPGRRTELRYLELELDVPVAAETFSLSRLERTR
ncbi:outer membrane lipoprotein-sorting protein [Anaeromyxobacter paludicola]|uniref:Outer membrane lipoprotein-sorting protein n=1 Tax=Anaeromyxobacter paludicola TaxID=2918171 RepID=A0ABN6N4V6_9BACT|nr:outer membrane lipoprotein-sorting protein [Anaeromyxobacter paludicola]BDG07065.1 outer membrane lipoprotein-sorting protein [Anaeromyxobacter paludicola]